MLSILLLIISSFVLVFVNGFFMQLFSFSIFILLAILLWERMETVQYLIYFPLLSIIIDVVLNLPFATHLLPVFIGILLLSLLRKFIPSEGLLPTLSIYFGVYLLTYILFEIFRSLFLIGVFPDITLSLILFSVIKSVISSVVVTIFTSLGGSVRSKNFGSIRLK